MSREDEINERRTQLFNWMETEKEIVKELRRKQKEANAAVENHLLLRKQTVDEIIQLGKELRGEK